MSSYKKRKYTKQKYTPFTKETKYFDVALEDDMVNQGGSWTNTELSTTDRVDNTGTAIAAYAFQALIPSAQGSGYGEVLGNKYLLKYIRVRGDLTSVAKQDQADVPKSTVCRLVLVLDKMARGAQAQGEDLFTDWGAVRANVHSFLAMGNNPGRFKILADKQFVINGTNAATDDTNKCSITNGTVNFSFFWKPKTALVVTLKGGTGSTPGITELAGHNIFLVALSTDSAASKLVVNACSRTYYSE